MLVVILQFDDEFVKKHQPQFESAEDLRTNLMSSTALARMKDVEAQIQDAIVTQVRRMAQWHAVHMFACWVAGGSTALAHMKDAGAQIQGAIVTQVRPSGMCCTCELVGRQATRWLTAASDAYGMHPFVALQSVRCDGIKQTCATHHSRFSAHRCYAMSQMSACVASSVPGALLRAQAENE